MCDASTEICKTNPEHGHAIIEVDVYHLFRRRETCGITSECSEIHQGMIIAFPESRTPLYYKAVLWEECLFLSCPFLEVGRSSSSRMCCRRWFRFSPEIETESNPSVTDGWLLWNSYFQYASQGSRGTKKIGCSTGHRVGWRCVDYVEWMQLRLLVRQAKAHQKRIVASLTVRTSNSVSNDATRILEKAPSSWSSTTCLCMWAEPRSSSTYRGAVRHWE